MKMRTTVLLSAAVISAPAAAYDYTDRAQVIAAIPIDESVRIPQRECWTESVPTYEAPTRSIGGSIVGALAGGVIGAQVGKGNGRIVASALGAAVGALVGDRMDGGDREAYAVTRPVDRCRITDTYRHELTGYEVTYRYRGRDATVMLPYDPGPSVLIGVEIADATRGPAAYVLPPTREYRRVEVTHVVYVDDDEDFDGNGPRKWKGGKHKGHGKWKKGNPHWY